MEMVDDNGVKWISAREYAQKHGVTKAWVIKLCHQGRIENAYKAGSVWMMPTDEPMPEKLARGPIPRLDSSRALKAATVAQNRAKREALKAMPKVAVDPSKLEGRERWVYMNSRDPNYRIHEKWIFPVNEDLEIELPAIDAAWAEGETVQEFRAREVAFKDYRDSGFNEAFMPADYAEFDRRDIAIQEAKALARAKEEGKM